MAMLLPIFQAYESKLLVSPNSRDHHYLGLHVAFSYPYAITAADGSRMANSFELIHVPM